MLERDLDMWFNWNGRIRRRLHDGWEEIVYSIARGVRTPAALMYFRTVLVTERD